MKLNCINYCTVLLYQHLKSDQYHRIMTDPSFVRLGHMATKVAELDFVRSVFLIIVILVDSFRWFQTLFYVRGEGVFREVIIAFL